MWSSVEKHGHTHCIWRDWPVSIVLKSSDSTQNLKGSMTIVALWPNSGVGVQRFESCQGRALFSANSLSIEVKEDMFWMSLVLKAWSENKPTWNNTLSDQKVVFTPYSKGAFSNGVMLSKTESNWILLTQQSTGFRSAMTSYCEHLQKFRFFTVCPSFPFWNQKSSFFPAIFPQFSSLFTLSSVHLFLFRAPF